MVFRKGQKKYRAEQVWDWLYIKRVAQFSEMNNLSKEVINYWKKILRSAHWKKRSNRNLLTARSNSFPLQDGNLIETF